MSRTLHYLSALAFALAGLPLLAQAPPPPLPRVVSPEVHSDATVTFRFRDPNAKEVLLAMEGTTRVPMQKDEQGVWSVTTKALAPDIYGYSFVADGVNLTDPVNHLMKPNKTKSAIQQQRGTRTGPAVVAVGNK